MLWSFHKNFGHLQMHWRCISPFKTLRFLSPWKLLLLFLWMRQLHRNTAKAAGSLSWETLQTWWFTLFLHGKCCCCILLAKKGTQTWLGFVTSGRCCAAPQWTLLLSTDCLFCSVSIRPRLHSYYVITISPADSAWLILTFKLLVFLLNDWCKILLPFPSCNVLPTVMYPSRKLLCIQVWCTNTSAQFWCICQSYSLIEL